MRKIILDTNFLLIPSQFNVDIFSEIDRIMHESYHLFVLDGTIDELQSIVKKQQGKDKKAAKLALVLLKQKKVGIIKTISKVHVDDILFQMAQEPDIIVATQDIGLKKRLRNKPTITLRQKNHLVLLNSL